MLPDQRRRLVQPATRGARTGTIGARQAITRSTPRRRARLRPRQPARPTAAVRRHLTCQAAATRTFTWAPIVSTSTPTRSAPATPARSCCAPVRPVLARPAEAPRGVDDSSSLGYSRATMGYSRATMGYTRGTMGYSRATMGYTRGFIAARKYPASGLKEALDAALGWMDAHGLPAWARELLRSHARSALGTPPTAGGTHRVLTACTTPSVDYLPQQAEGGPYLRTACTHAACL